MEKDTSYLNRTVEEMDEEIEEVAEDGDDDGVDEAYADYIDRELLGVS